MSIAKSKKPKPMSAPRVRIQIGKATALGPGKVALLEAIRDSGSISAAARDTGMSYRHAWVLVDAMNEAFSEDIVSTATGGKGGGGAKVTDFGLMVMERFRVMEEKAAKSVAAEAKAFAELLKPSADDEEDA